MRVESGKIKSECVWVKNTERMRIIGKRKG